MVQNLNRHLSSAENVGRFYVNHMTDIYWIKFYEQDGTIECWCPTGRKICPAEKKPSCKEYVVKFTEIQRSSSLQPKTSNPVADKLKRSVAELERVLKRKGVRI